MASNSVCPQGHRWILRTNGQPDVDEREEHCPECGAVASMVCPLESTTRLAATTSSAPPADSSASTCSVAAEGLPEIPGYELLSEIGRGGVGVIYRARHRASGQLVALKMLSAASHASATDLVRFRAEAQAIGRVSHPHLVRIYEVGEHQGLPFFALEYMDRGSLAQALGNAPLPPRYAAELVAMLAQAVEVAHQAGILHRDIKPANVLLCSQVEPPLLGSPVVRLLGLPKLTDFGIAKRLDGQAGVTHTGVILGTPAYMAPELAEGRAAQATTAVDIYALGAVLYECLTGKAPYQGSDPLEILDRVRGSDPLPPERLQPNLPPQLVTICLKAMAREPADRYPSAGALADDLQRFLFDQPVLARREPGWRRLTRWLRRQPVVASLSLSLALLACLCLLLALATLRLVGSRAAVVAEGPQVKYYSAVIRRFGIPQGIYRLEPEQVGRRELSFRLHFRGKRVEKVEAVDRFGRPTNRHSFSTYLERGDGDLTFRREVRWEYQYDDSGQLLRETALDCTGQVLWTFRYTTRTTGHYTDKRGFPRPRTGSGAAYVSFVFSEEGLVKELRYLNANGKPRADRNGIFGQRHDHDENGFVTGISFLGAEDQAVLHPDGYAREVRRYDSQGHRLETLYIGQDALPVLGPEGFARKTNRYDPDGNTIEVRTFGLDGQPTRRREGYAIEQREYDTLGRLTRLTYRDRFGNLVGDWYGIAQTEFHHSEDGKRCTEHYIGPLGKPTRHRLLGCTQLTRVFDDEGQEVETLAADLEPTPPGAALFPARDWRGLLPAPLIRRQHDENGNVTCESYFTAQGEPTLSWFGVHEVRTTYTDRGQRARVLFLDTQGQPSVPRVSFGATSREGPAQLEYIWDEAGNNIQIRALNLTGDPNDSWNLPLPAVLWNREGELPLPPGVASVSCRYDERGNAVELIHRGRDGNILPPTRALRGLITRGRLTLAYDEQGNLTEAALYGPDGKLAKDIGVARLTALHDEEGRPLEYVLYGPEGRIAGPGNISRVRISYDRQGNRTSESYFDTQDRPMLGPAGYAEARFSYDLSGHLTDWRFFDAAGNPVQTRVVVERAAEEAGPSAQDRPDPTDLKVGDVLLRYANKAISHTMQLYELKRREDHDRAPRPAEVLRDGKTVKVFLPSGLTGSEVWWDLRRRWGRSGGLYPFLALRMAPMGLTPPLTLGQVRLRTEVIPAASP